MRRIIFIGLLLCSMQLWAQENIDVKVKDWALNGAMEPAFVVDIPQSTSSDAYKLWKKTLVPKNLLDKFKRMPKMEKEGKNKWVMKDVVIDNICPDTLNVYTRIEEMDSRITFAALFESDNGFIGKENNKQAEKAKNYVRNFTLEAYRQAVKEEWNGLEKEVDKMQKQYSGLDRDNNKLDRQSIDTKASVEQLTTELAEKRKRYENGGDFVDGELKSPLSDEAKEQLKKAIKSKEKEIKKAKRAIEKYASNVDKNKSKQSELNTSIEETKSKIEAVKAKLENIK